MAGPQFYRRQLHRKPPIQLVNITVIRFGLCPLVVLRTALQVKPAVNAKFSKLILFRTRGNRIGIPSIGRKSIDRKSIDRKRYLFEIYCPKLLKSKNNLI